MGLQGFLGSCYVQRQLLAQQCMRSHYKIIQLKWFPTSIFILKPGRAILQEGMFFPYFTSDYTQKQKEKKEKRTVCMHL